MENMCRQEEKDFGPTIALFLAHKNRTQRSISHDYKATLAIWHQSKRMETDGKGAFNTHLSQDPSMNFRVALLRLKQTRISRWAMKLQDCKI